MSKRKTIYLNDDILEELERIASKNKMISPKGEINYTKAIVHAITQYKKIEQQQNMANDIADLAEKIEQVNVMIPHLFFQGNFTSRILSSKLNDDDHKKITDASLQQTARICGQIQKQTYKHVYVSIDPKNMKTIPIEEHENKWKLS